MWIYTRGGFVSVRASAFDQGSVVLRFRTLRHADSFAHRCGIDTIVTSDDSDYRYRFEVSRRTLADVLAKEVDGIDYPNFKASVEEADDENYVTALHRTWSIHHAMQKMEARR